MTPFIFLTKIKTISQSIKHIPPCGSHHHSHNLKININDILNHIQKIYCPKYPKIMCCPKNSAVKCSSQQSINKYTQKPHLPLWEAIFPLLLLSPFDFFELTLGYVEPLGLISLITWEKSSLKCMQYETELEESLEGRVLYQVRGGLKFLASCLCGKTV